jgi:CheY-like chemotaxis protein|tara:strand:- start:119 stop:490 length:372 start_codon:yes stop_codon:yes gene_type:complete
MEEGKKILLVDDSRISRLMLKAIIKANYPSWETVEAEDGEAALKLCQYTEFDFISLDMNMPGRDGLTISPELQDLCPNAKIALLTANFHERVKDKAKAQGLSFIPKPITEEKIVEYLAKNVVK